MTELSKDWRRYTWGIAVAGLAVVGCLLWQLPFPSNVLVVLLIFSMGRMRLRIEKLEQWCETELKIEQELAEHERRGPGNVTH